MLFVIDVGNSHTVTGLFVDGQLVEKFRLKSDRERTVDELAIRYHSLFQMADIAPQLAEGHNVSKQSTQWLCDVTPPTFLSYSYSYS